MARPKRPLAILRRDSTGSSIGNGGTIDQEAAPCKGYEIALVHLRCPTANGTLAIQQRMRGSSTFVQTDTFSPGGAGWDGGAAIIVGEHIRCLFTNGATAQVPEILVTLH